MGMHDQPHQITITGRLTTDPELRYTPSGAAVANLTIAHNRRRYDKQRQEWVEDGTDYYRCQAWRELAENIADTCKKGDPIIAVGALTQRAYETRDGEKRTTWEVTLDAAGTDLRWVKPTTATSGFTGTGTTGYQQAPPTSEDPWARPTTAQTSTRDDTEPPF